MTKMSKKIFITIILICVVAILAIVSIFISNNYFGYDESKMVELAITDFFNAQKELDFEKAQEYAYYDGDESIFMIIGDEELNEVYYEMMDFDISNIDLVEETATATATVDMELCDYNGVANHFVNYISENEVDVSQIDENAKKEYLLEFAPQYMYTIETQLMFIKIDDEWKFDVLATLDLYQ